jgi:hypothetical protein
MTSFYQMVYQCLRFLLIALAIRWNLIQSMENHLPLIIHSLSCCSPATFAMPIPGYYTCYSLHNLKYKENQWKEVVCKFTFLTIAQSQAFLPSELVQYLILLAAAESRFETCIGQFGCHQRG